MVLIDWLMFFSWPPRSVFILFWYVSCCLTKEDNLISSLIINSIDFSWLCLVVPGLLVMSLTIPFLLQPISRHSFSIPDLQCPLVSKEIFTDLLSMFPHVLACSQSGIYNFATPSKLSFTAFVFNFAATSSAIYFLSWSWFYHLHNLLSMFPFLHDFSFCNNCKIMMETEILLYVLWR